MDRREESHCRLFRWCTANTIGFALIFFRSFQSSTCIRVFCYVSAKVGASFSMAALTWFKPGHRPAGTTYCDIAVTLDKYGSLNYHEQTRF